ncbi:hypothetical protein NRIC_27270 [Enterococcus florum]|uniref:DeoR C-terminal sensor domain-containing protein n=1 Tax=Enterococcus florum TaxID=2480627 RepID=A0A4P5PAY3_9ENTE|nr:hypothetical protein [Enterococcus florum]GCF94836.1 hypothetical protein NRIC_27270 [Enterococcus florum]
MSAAMVFLKKAKIHFQGELGVKRRMVEKAVKTVLLSDTSKLSRSGGYGYADFSAIDVMVTERPLTETERQQLSEDLLLAYPEE